MRKDQATSLHTVLLVALHDGDELSNVWGSLLHNDEYGPIRTLPMTGVFDGRKVILHS